MLNLNMNKIEKPPILANQELEKLHRKQQSSSWCTRLQANAFEWGYMLLSLLFLLGSFVISAPLIFSIAIFVHLIQMVYNAKVIAQDRTNHAKATTYLAMTNEKTWHEATQLVDTIYFKDKQDQSAFLNKSFWLALARVHNTDKAIFTAWTRLCVHRQTSTFENRFKNQLPRYYDDKSEIKINVEKIKEDRAKLLRKNPRKLAKLDYDNLYLVMPYVKVGSRTTFSLQVITDYLATLAQNERNEITHDLTKQINKIYKKGKKEIAPDIQAVLDVFQDGNTGNVPYSDESDSELKAKDNISVNLNPVLKVLNQLQSTSDYSTVVDIQF